MKLHDRKCMGGLLLAAALLSTAACHKPQAEYAGGIEFEARAPVEELTKLGYRAPDGGETMNGSRVLLHWSQGDHIRIIGENAGRAMEEAVNWQDYQVSSVSAKAGDYTQSVATIECIAPANKLKWLDQERTSSAQLFAVYPSPKQLEGQIPAEHLSAIGTGLGIDGMMAGYISGTQTLVRRSTDSDGAAYNIFDAPMQFAYLGAKQGALPGETVSFAFEPLFTAFVFTVTASEAFPAATITKMRLYNAGLTLAGPFSCDLSGSTPVITPSGTGEAIEVTFPDGGVTAVSGKPVVFTVLALGCSHTGLTIVFEGPAIGRRSLTFKDSNGILSFEGRKRYRFGELSFPSTLNLAYGEDIDWNGMLNDGEDLDWDGSNLNWGESVTWE